MGSKGGGTQKVESKTTTSNLPEYARPYFERMMDRAEGLSLTPYEAYPGQRIADITPDQLAAYDLTRQTAAGGIPGLDTAMGVTGQNLINAQNIAAGATPYQFGPSSFQAAGVSPYMGFQSGQASPYMGFQGTQFDTFGGYQAARPDSFADQFSLYGGFQKGAADPYAGFRETQVSPYAGFERSEFGPAADFVEGDVRQFTDFSAGSADPYADFEQYTGFRRGDEGVAAYEFDPARQFTSAEAEQYMSPYIQNVVDI